VLTTNLLVDLANTIKENTAGVRSLPGTRIVNAATGEVVYTPPEGESLIRDKLRDLETFCNTTNDVLDPLIKMTLIHYQFEAIHPFYDGNGRTGRILVILYLMVSGLLDQPILYLSRFFIENKSEYYNRLGAVTAVGEWEPWILYVLRGVAETARDTHEKILAIGDLLARTLEEAKSRLPKSTYSKELVEQTFVLPYCRIRNLEEAGLGNRHTCSRYLSQMEAAGMLISKRYGRENVFINHRLMRILTGESLAT
jgi:Fic family protein